MKKSQMIVLIAALIAAVALVSFTYGIIKAVASVSPDPRLLSEG